MNTVKETVKTVVIGILAIVAIILIISIVSYNKIAIRRVVPMVKSYELSDEIKNELEKEESSENSTTIVTYQLDATDLQYYEKTKEYNKGKKNPFAPEETTSTNGNSTSSSSSSSSSSGSESGSSSSTNFYDDEGTK